MLLLRQTICRHLRRSRPETVPAASPSRRRAQTWCDLFVAPCALNVFLREGARLGALGVGGCNRLRLRFFSSLRPRICPRLLGLATKDYSDRLLADFDHLLNRGPISSISLFVRVSPRTPLAFQYDVRFSWSPRPSRVMVDVPR
jgi:hypothetical protein